MVFTQSHFLDYRRLVQISGFHANKLSWYPVPWNLTRRFYIRRLRIYWRFSVPKIINIVKDLSEIFEKITSVRFFWDTVYLIMVDIVFTVRRSLHGLSYRNSIRPSVCPSVTLVHCVHMVRPTTMISSPCGSPIILVSGISSSSQNSKGITPSEGV